MTAQERLIDGPGDAPLTVLFAHGAGAGMDTPAMDTFSTGLAEQGYRVIRFEFPYMQRVRAEGKRRPPDRAPILIEHLRGEIRACGVDPSDVVLAGRSMGGRMSSLVADEYEVAGLICLGYPFHPPGKPDRLRTEHLEDISTPTLILQGERDTFGTPEEVSGYTLSRSIRIEWIPDGDHGFKPRKKSGHTQESNLALAVEQMVKFLSAVR